MADKPPFDPSQPFQAVAPQAPQKPAFDPSQPYQAVSSPQPDTAAPRQLVAIPGHDGQPTVIRPAPADFSAERAVTQGATGFNEGLASTVIRPLDAIPYFVDRAIGGEGVHPLENTFRKYFVDPNGEPQNRAEQVLRAGGRMAGDNLPMLAAGAGAAANAVRGATAIVEGAPTTLFNAGQTVAEQAANNPGVVGTIRNAADTVAQGIANNPVSSMAGEFAGATSSGAGGQIGHNVAEDAGLGPQGQQAAEMVGQFATPFAIHTYETGIPVPGTNAHVPLSPTMAAAKAGKYVAGKVLDTVPAEILPESLRPGVGTPESRRQDRLDYGNREGKYADPNVPPPPAGNFVTRRMDQGAQNRERAAAEAAGKEFNQIVSQPDAAANLAESRRLEQEIPGFQPGVAKGTQDPALLRLQEHLESQATGDELRRVQQAHDQNAAAIQTKLDNIVPPAGANPQDTVAAANAARVQNTQRAVSQDISNQEGLIQRRSNALPEADRAEIGQGMRELRHGEELASDAHTQELAAAIGDPNTRIMMTPGPDGTPDPNSGTTLGAAMQRRGQINNDVRDIASGRKVVPDQRAEIERLGQERDAIDAAIRQVNAPAFDEYLRYYRDEHVPRFESGPSRKVGQYDQFAVDKNRIADENVPAQFFGPNNITGARQYNELFGTGNAPESVHARQLMTDYALDDLRHNVVDPETGQIKEGAVDRWLTKNERVLNEMPWVRDAVAARNPDQLYQRLGDLEQRGRAVADTKVAQLVGKNPEQHIDAALNDWQTMRGLKSSMRGDPDAEAALRRAVMERAPDPNNPDKFEKWLDDHDRALRQVLDPSHLKALHDVLAAARMNNQLPRPTGSVDMPGSLADKGAKVFGITVPSLLQRMLAVKQGRMSPEYGVADVVTRAVRQFSNKEIENAWKEALYNPKVARDLEVMSRQGATPIQLARMRNYLLSVGMADATGTDKEQKPNGR